MTLHALMAIGADPMRRFRLSTLLLVIVIAALGTALLIQHRREAELQARLAEANAVVGERYALGILSLDGNHISERVQHKGVGE